MASRLRSKPMHPSIARSPFTDSRFGEMALNITQPRERFPVTGAGERTSGDDMPGNATDGRLAPEQQRIHESGIERVTRTHLVTNVDEARRRYDRAVDECTALPEADHDAARTRKPNTLFEVGELPRTPEGAPFFQTAEVPIDERQQSLLGTPRFRRGRP